jgi:hypothetical protein
VVACNSEIKVSVCVVTYNQKNYIRQCLQSLIDQVTDFKFEIIVGDDCSTDGTKEIVEEFSGKYTELITPIYHQNNVGPLSNLISVYKLAQANYIAHVDGDDCAKPGKLQAQVEALDSHPECAMCSHDVEIVNPDGELLRSSFYRVESGTYDLMYLYKNLPFFAHSSKMFRNDLFEGYWEELEPRTLDVELHIRQALKGDIYHIDATLGLYRAFSGISWLGKDVAKSLFVDRITKIFETAIRERHCCPEILKGCYAQSLIKKSYKAAVMGDGDLARELAGKSMQLDRISFSQKLIYLISFSPSLLVRLCQVRARIRGYEV